VGKRPNWLVPLIVAVLVVLAGVAWWYHAQAVAEATRPYTLGAIISQSGPSAALGKQEVDAIHMAVAEINAKGGINGHPLDVTILDDKSDNTTAEQAFKELIAQKVLGIIGSTSSGATMVGIPDAQAAGIPVISLASLASIVQPVAQRHWIFKVPGTDVLVMNTIIPYLKAHGLTRVAFMYANYEYGTAAWADWQATAPPQGITTVDSEVFSPTAADVTVQLTHIRATNPQAVVVWAIMPNPDTVIKDYREMGLPYPIFFSDGSANSFFVSTAGPAAHGAFVAGTKILVADQLPASDPQKAILEHYIQAFDQAYPKDGPASMFGGFAYDAVYMFDRAISQAGPDPAKIRDALENMSYAGVTGVFHMSAEHHNGLDPSSEILTQVENGKFTLVPTSTSGH